MRPVVFLFILILIESVISEVNSRNKVKSGPYRAVVSKAERCKKPSKPYDKNPPIVSEIGLVNDKKDILLNGNVTVLRNDWTLMVIMKNYILSNGKWKLTHLMNMSCQGPLFGMILNVIGVDYDREHCNIKKGSYILNNFDPNAIQHLWASKQEYGKMLWRSEMLSQSTTYVCWEFESVVEPL